MNDDKTKSDPLELKDLPGLNAFDLEDIEKRLKEAKDKTSEFVKEHPLTSVAIALGIGYFISRLVAGKK